MLLRDMMAEIEKHETFTPGYRVHFEIREGGMLQGEYAPDRNEDTIPTEAEAWALAHRFAATDPRGNRYVNIFVIHANDWTPVSGYYSRTLNRHPPDEGHAQPESVDAVARSVEASTE